MNPRFPKIKICGVGSSEDLQLIADAGADTVGINLVPGSHRHVELRVAGELADRAQQLGLRTVAVLMNPTAEVLRQVVDVAAWNFVQLHGVECPELLESCSSIQVIKAISWSGRKEEADLANAWSSWGKGGNQVLPLRESIGVCPELSCFLIDAYAPLVGGGTGRTADWEGLQPRPEPLRPYPLLLAGGLTPENVRKAIAMTRCEGVDVASGVELRPGQKSADLVATFVANAMAGFLESNVKPLQ